MTHPFTAPVLEVFRCYIDSYYLSEWFDE